MASGRTSGLINASMKATGSKTSCTDPGCTLGPMDANTMENTKTIRKMDKVRSIGPMAGGTPAGGARANSTARRHSQPRTVSLAWVSGRMARGSAGLTTTTLYLPHPQQQRSDSTH